MNLKKNIDSDRIIKKTPEYYTKLQTESGVTKWPLRTIKTLKFIFLKLVIANTLIVSFIFLSSFAHDLYGRCSNRAVWMLIEN